MKRIILFAAFLIFVSSSLTKARTYFNGDVSFNFFYSSLSPYGEWIEIDNDLYAWKPDRVSRNWMPYSVGRWVWTNQGWYWDSYEPYGWATYHYGRWYDDDYYGWIWVPDYDWAPAWVEWRYNDDYIGWAPLPPYASFSINSGIHFSISWNSPHHYWNFVHYNHFCGYDIDRYVVGEKYRNRIYNNTRYRNDYGYRDGRVINRGVERDFVERRSGGKIAERDMVETSKLRDNVGSRTRDDRRVEVYRPSNDDVKKSREINKIEVKRNDRKTSLEVSKVDIKERMKPDSRKVESRTRDENVKAVERNKIEVKRNIDTRTTEPKREIKTNTNTGRDVLPKNEIERKVNQNENRVIEKPVRVNSEPPKREVRILENNKPRNEAPRIENRSSGNKNVEVRERPKVEERKVEPKKETSRDNSSRSSNGGGERRR
ncbi:MAG: hypothetical protein NTX22_03085 [Ignavibacteriales bacterium]|nr:hypothetical protein [Ignavibacteriales bacterium]